MIKKEVLQFYYRYKFYLFPALSAVVGILLIALVIAPQALIFFSNRSALESHLERIDFLGQKIEKLNSLNESDLKKKTEIMLTVLPENKDYSNTLGLIQSIVGNSGFVITNFQIGSAFTNSATGSFGFNIKIEVAGQRESFKSFLEGIENSNQILKVSSIEINEQKAQNRMESIVSIDVFYANLPKTIGAINATLPEITEKDQQLINKYQKLGNSLTPVSTVAASLKGKLDPFE